MPKIKFTTTLDDKLVKYVKIEAIEQGISAAAFIEMLIKKYQQEKNTLEENPDD